MVLATAIKQLRQAEQLTQYVPFTWFVEEPERVPEKGIDASIVETNEETGRALKKPLRAL